jgi:hypothetical protein
MVATAPPPGRPVPRVRAGLKAFLQGVLDHPANGRRWSRLSRARGQALAAELWREGLLLTCRLLFLLHGEASGAFPFAKTAWWHDGYSPGSALGEMARRILDSGSAPLEAGLRRLFAGWEDGFPANPGCPRPAGRLFRRAETPLLEACAWGDGCAALLDDLIESVGDRKVEDLSRAYEALLDLEPGLATEPMARLRRGSLEIVVPLGPGWPSTQARSASADTGARSASAGTPHPRAGASGLCGGPLTPPCARRVRCVEDLVPRPGSPGRFYLRAGLGRKATGSFYTPPDLARFLARETLAPQVEALSPASDPRPRELLALTVLDPAMGSGHFLVEACRFLGDRLEEACHAAAARGLWERIPAEIAPHLAGTAPQGRTAVLAVCKAAVAARCLYGVDRDGLVVEFARACLWLEAGSATLPWQCLERHLVHGDSLIGPFAADLPHLKPPSPGECPGEVEQCLRRRLSAALSRGDCGNTGEALQPFCALALAWSGAVMARGAEGTTDTYQRLVAHVAGHGALPEPLPAGVRSLLRRGASTGGPALSFDLAFPEVFYPGGWRDERQGFHAVLCNPPWEALRPAEKEFFAAYDVTVLDAPTARERSARIAELKCQPAIRARWSAERDRIEGQKACHDRLYIHQKVRVGNDLAGRYSDSYRVFAERAAQLVRPGGQVGLVLPAAFHANEGATGIRRLYLERMALRCCYSFVNRRRLFPIDVRCKFALVVATRGGPTTEFPCAFYLQDPACLFGRHQALRYSLESVRRTGGDYLTFLEARDPEELEVLTQLLARGRSLESLEPTHRLVFRTEPYAFNVTTHGPLFTPASPPAAACLPLQEGKSIHQLTDRWEAPRYAVPVDAAAGRPAALANAGFFRLAFRTIANATNERTAI